MWQATSLKKRLTLPETSLEKPRMWPPTSLEKPWTLLPTSLEKPSTPLAICSDLLLTASDSIVLVINSPTEDPQIRVAAQMHLDIHPAQPITQHTDREAIQLALPHYQMRVPMICILTMASYNQRVVTTLH